MKQTIKRLPRELALHSPLFSDYKRFSLRIDWKRLEKMTVLWGTAEKYNTKHYFLVRIKCFKFNILVVGNPLLANRMEKFRFTSTSRRVLV